MHPAPSSRDLNVVPSASQTPRVASPYPHPRSGVASTTDRTADIASRVQITGGPHRDQIAVIPTNFQNPASRSVTHEVASSRIPAPIDSIIRVPTNSSTYTTHSLSPLVGPAVHQAPATRFPTDTTVYSHATFPINSTHGVSQSSTSSHNDRIIALQTNPYHPMPSLREEIGHQVPASRGAAIHEVPQSRASSHRDPIAVMPTNPHNPSSSNGVHEARSRR
jgi:hypothetical protein